MISILPENLDELSFSIPNHKNRPFEALVSSRPIHFSTIMPMMAALLARLERITQSRACIAISLHLISRHYFVD